MSHLDREQNAREYCLRLVLEIGRTATLGAGLDDSTWNEAAAVQDRFLAELHRWEDEGDDARVPRIRELYSEVLDTWRSSGNS